MGKVRCIKIECGDDVLTVGKVYDILRIDSDGDIFIIADDGERYFLYPSEAEILEDGE
jgi:hypothetical protein